MHQRADDEVITIELGDYYETAILPMPYDGMTATLQRHEKDPVILESKSYALKALEEAPIGSGYVVEFHRKMFSGVVYQHRKICEYTKTALNSWYLHFLHEDED